MAGHTELAMGILVLLFTWNSLAAEMETNAVPEFPSPGRVGDRFGQEAGSDVRMDAGQAPEATPAFRRNADRSGTESSPRFRRPDDRGFPAPGANVRVTDDRRAQDFSSSPRQRDRRRFGQERADSSSGGSTNIAEGDFDQFKIIYERNIFDPNRRPRRFQREEVPPTRIETFTLNGTMFAPDGTGYAFFDGSEPRYHNLALTVSNAIGGLKLTEITPDYVCLQSGTNAPIELGMNMQMRKRDENPWELIAGTRWADTSATASTLGDSSGSDAGADDVVKRLMAKRLKEGGTIEPNEAPQTTAAASEPVSTPQVSAINASDSPADDITQRLIQRRRQQESNQ